MARKLLIIIDKFFNWISGGNIDNTISARVGFYVIHMAPNPFWNLLESVINIAFWPIDGPEHCADAYVKESNRDNTPDFRVGPKWSLALLSVFVSVGCSIIALILWSIKAVKNIKAK